MPMADAFSWSPGMAPPRLETHSEAKLRVFRGYLQKYFDRLTINPAMDFLNLSLVDGFCGGGSFSQNGSVVVGTPLIMIEEVERARERLNRGRRKPLNLNVKFYFNDISEDHIAFLRAELIRHGYANRLGRDIEIMCNPFDDALPDILNDIKTRHRGGRSIFLLDQCGYTHVALHGVRTIFSMLPASEVILTFAADALINFLNDRPDFTRSMLPLELSEERVSDLIEMSDGRGGRALIQRVLRDHLRIQTGAQYDTPFFIRPAVSRRALWFVHLSNHPTARDVMLNEHWAEGNTFIHHGPGDLGMLGFDTFIDGGLFDFVFDEDADRRTRMQLLAQLPGEIAGRTVDAPITLDGFHREIANRNAATRDKIEDILLELWDAKELTILAANGRERSRSTRRLRAGDLIAIPDAPSFPGFLRRKA